MRTGNKTRTKDKYRVVYTEQQKVELEKEFLFSQYITIQRKAELAASIGLSDRQVKIWFQNRRAKERKSRRRHDDRAPQLPQAGSTSMGVASVLAPVAVGGAKTLMDDTRRLRGQLHPHHLQGSAERLQHRSDVIKMETVKRVHNDVTSSTPQSA